VQKNAISSEQRDQTIISHLPLVRYVQRRLSFSYGCGISDGEDLYSYGVLGLIQAVDHFDPNRQVSFAGYARTRIRGAILDGLRQTDEITRTSRAACSKIELSRRALRFSLEREPTRAELISASGLSTRAFDAAQFEESVRPMHLDALKTGETAEGSAMEVRDSSLPEASAELERADLHVALVRAIGLLPPREKLALSMYYQDGLRVMDVSRALGISPSRAGQLMGQGLRRLSANQELRMAA